MFVKLLRKKYIVCIDVKQGRITPLNDYHDFFRTSVHFWVNKITLLVTTACENNSFEKYNGCFEPMNKVTNGRFG